MASKLYELGLSLVAKLDPSLLQSFSRASGAVDSYDKAVNALSKHQNDLDRVMKQRESTLAAARAFQQAKQRVQELGASMKATKTPTAGLQAEYAQAQAAVSRASAAFEKQKATLQQLQASTGMTGKSIKQLKLEEEQLAQAANKAAQAKKLQEKAESLKESRVSSGAQFAVGAGQMMMLKSLASNLAAPIQLGMEFDKTMARVGAVSNASAEDLERLRKQARELGASTVFSASQAAEGMTYLAMAGFKTDDMLAAMPGMLNLASAGQVDLASASDIAASMLNGFGLKADQINRVADTMVNTFANSSTDLQGLGETMKYATPVAASLGVNIETVAAMAGKLGDNAIRGSQAGTAMRAVMTRLVAPASKGAKALQALGVNVKDSEGNVRNMPDVLKDIGLALAKLPQAAQAAIKNDIFGQEAMSAAGILMNSAVDGTLQGLIDKVGEAGAAERVAKQQNDNLAGGLASLNSAFEELQLILSDTLKPALQSITNWLTNAMQVVGKFAIENQGLIKALVAVGVGIGGIVAAMATFNMAVGGIGYVVAATAGGFLKLWQGVMMAQKAFVAIKGVMLAVNATMLANPIGLICAAIAALVAAGVLLYQNWDTVKAKAAELWSWFSENFPGIAGFVANAFNAMGERIEAIKQTFSELIDFVKNVFTGNWSAAWENAKNVVANVFSGLVNMVIAPINMVIQLINKFISYANKIHVDLPLFGEVGVNIPEIPLLAAGGIATAPTLAMIGEGGEDEAVLPLSKLSSLLQGNMTGGGSQPVSIVFNPTINVQSDGGDGSTLRELNSALRVSAEQIKREIQHYFNQKQRVSYV